MEAFNAMEYTNLSVDDLNVAGSILENWLNEQEAEVNQAAEQSEMELDEEAA